MGQGWLGAFGTVCSAESKRLLQRRKRPMSGKGPGVATMRVPSFVSIPISCLRLGLSDHGPAAAAVAGRNRCRCVDARGGKVRASLRNGALSH